jgi:hypothetical protein
MLFLVWLVPDSSSEKFGLERSPKLDKFRGRKSSGMESFAKVQLCKYES